MSLLFIDSFDHYDRGSMDKKWSFVDCFWIVGAETWSLHVGAGRDGSTALRFIPRTNSATAAVNVAAQSTLYAGFAVKMAKYGSDQNQTFLEFSSGKQVMIGYAMSGGGQIGVWKGDFTTFLGRASCPLNQGQWYYVETRNTVHSATGQIDIRIDGKTEFTFTGDTLTGTVASLGRISVGRGVGTISVEHIFLMDDFYLLDDQGTRNNGFLGDVRVMALMPNSDGDTIQWDPSTTGNNWQMVDETIPDSDRTYNSTSVTAEIDTFHMTDLGIGSAYVLAAQAVFMARQDDPSRSVRPILTTNGSAYAGATVGLTGSKYTFIQEIFELNPVTATSWTVAEVDSHQAGYELVA